MDEGAYLVQDMFKAARVGDLDRIRILAEERDVQLNIRDEWDSTPLILAEERDVQLNIRDEWDSTPLYYACLCGHEDLVDFMLRNGARCEANTFDGERCLYAALTQKIKKKLREYKAITSECMRRDQYQEFLRACTTQQSFEDIFFNIGGETIAAHKIILAARCPYFAEKLRNKWKNRDVIVLKQNVVSVTAFRHFIQYLYVGRLNMPLNEVNDFTSICKQCKMDKLVDDVEKAVRNFHTYVDTKPEYMRNRVSMISIGDGNESADLQTSLSKVAECCTPNSLRFKQYFGAVPEIFTICVDEDYPSSERYLMDEDGRPCFTDVCFIVQGHEFFCHKVFLCGRSDYFKALRHFNEAEQKDCHQYLEVSLKEISPDAFAAVVNFIYSDKCNISNDIVYELLYFSDLFLLPGLKLRCAAFLAEELSPDNIIAILRLARLHQLDRLESQCCEYIANNLSEIVYREEFSDVVIEDASAIQERQDTDTIQIIDDVRYHVLKFALPGMTSNCFAVDVNGRLALLDSVLHELNLDA